MFPVYSMSLQSRHCHEWKGAGELYLFSSHTSPSLPEFNAPRSLWLPFCLTAIRDCNEVSNLNFNPQPIPEIRGVHWNRRSDWTSAGIKNVFWILILFCPVVLVPAKLLLWISGLRVWIGVEELSLFSTMTVQKHNISLAWTWSSCMFHRFSNQVPPGSHHCLQKITLCMWGDQHGPMHPS